MLHLRQTRTPANVCPDKTKINAHAQSALHKNKSFMALWQNSFADTNQEKCATRFVKTWMDDLCPTCMREISFDHRCDPNDIAIAKHSNSSIDSDAMATFELCLMPVFIKKKVLLKQTSVLLITLG
jgi:hypothetical protein